MTDKYNSTQVVRQSAVILSQTNSQKAKENVKSVLTKDGVVLDDDWEDYPDEDDYEENNNVNVGKEKTHSLQTSSHKVVDNANERGGHKRYKKESNGNYSGGVHGNYHQKQNNYPKNSNKDGYNNYNKGYHSNYKP